MGQGTDSCGGYDVEYDPYEEGLSEGLWMQRDHSTIHVSKMSETHIKNARRMCVQMYQTATFSDQQDKWDNWITLFDDELALRPKHNPKPTIIPRRTSGPKPIRGKTIEMICHCGCKYQARIADLKRGWAFSCDKSCAAIRRDFGRPKAKPSNPEDIKYFQK